MANAPQNKNGPKKKKKPGVADDEIFKAPEIAREPSSKQVKLGGKISLRIDATGKPLPSFQWYQNGIKIIGATNERLMINKSRRNHSGAYTCEVKNFVGKVMSRAAMVSFYAEKIPDIVIGPKNAAIESGKPFKFEIIEPSADKLKEFSFKWVFNGKRINGATNTCLEFTQVKKKYEGEYKVVLVAGSEIRTSNTVTLKILEKDTPPPEVVETVEAAVAPEPAPEPMEDLFFDPEMESDFTEPAPAFAEAAIEPINISVVPEEIAPAEAEDAFFTPEEIAPAEEIPTYNFGASSEDGTVTKLCRKKEVLERFLEALKQPKVELKKSA
jgi:hypothetical protein